jgi:hypothetical protein
VVGTVLLISASAIRNYVVAREFVPIASNAGVNLYIGNNERATGLCTAELPEYGKFATCYDYPRIVETVQRRAGRRLGHAGVSSYFAGEAFRFMREHPGVTARRLLKKSLLFWGPREITHNKVVEMDRDASRVLRWAPVRFPLVLALALLGILMLARDRHGRGGGRKGALESRRRWEFSVLLMLLVLAWFASILPFFVSARYRVPVIPLLLVFGAYGAVGLVREVASGGATRGARWLAVAVGLYAAACVNFAGYEPNRAKWHNNRGMSYAAIGDFERAIGCHRAALRENPEHWQSQLDLGIALASTGRVAESVPHFREALRLNPGNPFVQYNVGLLLEALGRPEESVYHLAEARRLDPAFPGVSDDLARVTAVLAESRRAGRSD